MSRQSSNMHVHQDNSVVERRLRPIYDWLDSGNNKKALQECDKVLRKTPNLPCAKALKALTFHRMGKNAECRAILDALTEEKPTEETTLQAMTLCYREMHQLGTICKLYETAIKIDPGNEELHTHLFMSYVRIWDFKAQQQCAMALYKNKPKNPYYCWAVMSIILQATRGEDSKDPQKRHLLLSLAKRMFSKLIAENKVDAEQEVQLYIMILELLGHYEEILAVLEGPLGSRLQCGNTSENKIKYLKKLQWWNDINSICKDLLIECIDRWDIWKEYIHSVFELMSDERPLSSCETVESGDSEVDFDDTPEKAHEFICRVIENGAENDFLLRSPYLARFELCAKLSERNRNTTELLGDTSELFIEYFRKFGHKSCCVSDLRNYLYLLDSDKKIDMSTRLIKDVGISSTTVPQTEKQMQRHICALQLSRLCGAHSNLSADHLKALVTALSLHYQHGYQAFGKDLLSTDLGPSDPYALMAVHILCDLAEMEGNSDSIIVALVLIENLLKNSPSNFHAKLLAIKLYHIVGGAASAHDLYNSLDVKHLQLDSLGYIHCARLPTTGLFTTCVNLFNVTLKFFSSNFKDSNDQLTFSYKYGSFLKLEEFMDFNDRFLNSIHYITATIDRILLGLVESMSLDSLYFVTISCTETKINWETLRFNYDLSVYVSWDPKKPNECPNSWEERDELFNQDVRFLKLRSYMLYSVATAVDIVKSTDGTRQQHLEYLKNILNDWRQLHEQTIMDNVVPIRQDLLPLPLPSRLHGVLEVPYFAVFNSFFELLMNLAVDNMEYASKCVESIENELSQLTKFLEEKTIKSSQDLLDKRKSMELVVNCVEIVSITSLICLLCNELVGPPQGKKARKKSLDSGGREHITAVAEKLSHEMNRFCDILQNWMDLDSVESVTNKIDSLNLNSNPNVLGNIVYSYNIANKEMQLILKTKMKMLLSLGG